MNQTHTSVFDASFLRNGVIYCVVILRGDKVHAMVIQLKVVEMTQGAGMIRGRCHMETSTAPREHSSRDFHLCSWLRGRICRYTLHGESHEQVSLLLQLSHPDPQFSARRLVLCTKALFG